MSKFAQFIGGVALSIMASTTWAVANSESSGVCPADPNACRFGPIAEFLLSPPADPKYVIPQRKPVLVLPEDPGFMARPAFRKRWGEAFVRRLSEATAWLADEADGAARATVLQFAREGTELIGRRLPDSFWVAGTALSQSGARVADGSLDPFDPVQVMAAGGNDLMRITAEQMVGKRLADAMVARASGPLGRAAVVGGVATAKVGMVAGGSLLATMAYYAYQDAVAYSVSIPDTVMPEAVQYLMTRCNHGGQTPIMIRNDSLWSSSPDAVSLSLRDVSCAWRAGKEPCMLNSCDVVEFRQSVNGRWSDLTILTLPTPPMMTEGLRRPGSEPPPLPAWDGPDDVYREIYELKEASEAGWIRIDITPPQPEAVPRPETKPVAPVDAGSEDDCPKPPPPGTRRIGGNPFRFC